jgi:hypothetical protein
VHFVAPALLAGLVAAALPWFIHRIGRRRARPRAFAAMELLLRAEREISARRRLRELLLLALRTLVAAALPLVFARPFTEVRSDLPASTTRTQSAVVVLDDSASLRRLAAAGGDPVFAKARARARALVEHLSPDSDVALVLAAEGAAAPVAEPSTDRARVVAALEGVACSARRADFGSALRRASQILTASAHAERVVYVVTDLQAAGWDGVAGPTGDASAPAVVVLDVGGPWENRAVVSLEAEPAPDVGAGAGAQAVALVAEIANFSDAPAHKLGVTLRLDGADVARGFVDVPAHGRAKKRFLHTLAGTGAAHDAEVEIDHDLFPLDDRRRARVEASRGLRVLVVDGDPRTVRTEDETFFLEAALRAGGGGFSISTALPDELAPSALPGYAAVFLANVARPSPELASALVRYVEGGGGLFVSVGDRVDADTWNARLAAVLPQPLGLKRTASAAASDVTAPAEGETVDLRPAERLAPLDRRHPLLSSFPAKGDGLASARFSQFMLLAPVPDAPGRSVVLRFENGAPALVSSEVGRGRVLLLTTTVDREWTDLPIRPGFLPLVQEAARYLAGAPGSESVAALAVGQRREIALGADDRRIEVLSPGGASTWLTPEARPTEGRAADAHARRTVAFDHTDEPGLYRVRASRADGTVEERVEERFVVDLDVGESDPAPLPEDRRPDHSRAAAEGGAAPKSRLELWHALGAVILVAVLAESLLTLRRRRGRVKA